MNNFLGNYSAGEIFQTSFRKNRDDEVYSVAHLLVKYFRLIVGLFTEATTS